jgi:hypothetical protein
MTSTGSARTSTTDAPGAVRPPRTPSGTWLRHARYRHCSGHSKIRTATSAPPRRAAWAGSPDPRAVKPLVDALAHRSVPHGVAAHALLGIGPEALEPLRALVDDDEAEVRVAAVGLIGLLGGAVDAELVAARLRDTSAEVRAKATRALGRLGAQEETAQLRAALDDRIGFVRATAAIALRSIGDRESVPALLALARESSFDAAQAAAKALARIDPATLERTAAEPGAALALQEAADVDMVRT